MLVETLTFIIGVIIVLFLANIIIKNSIELAKHFGLSGTFIGLTILSIGTSIPEIMTHVIGSINILKDPSQMNTLSSLLIGTSIGSDIFQQSFVLGLIGIVGTVIVVRKNLFPEMGALIWAAALVWVFSLGGFISRSEGAVLLLAYLGYLFFLKTEKINEEFKADNHLTNRQVVWSILFVVVCFILVGFVSNIVLGASTMLVSYLPMSASFFGIILLGVSTALPELTTSLMAVLKKDQGMSAGILIGSNITNPLFGIGLGALISGYKIPNVFVFYDLPFKIGIAFLIYYFLWKKQDISKLHGTILIGLFLVYLFFRLQFFPVDF
jgi:cation:H+ antiporter